MEQLSAGGSERRERILEMALRAARERRYRRLAKNGAVMAVLLVAGFVMWHATGRNRAMVKESKVVAARLNVAKPVLAMSVMQAARRPGVTIVWIQTDPNILKQMEEPRPKGHWQRIGDDELLKCLAEAGKPSGLVEFGGKVLVLSGD